MALYASGKQGKTTFCQEAKGRLRVLRLQSGVFDSELRDAFRRVNTPAAVVCSAGSLAQFNDFNARRVQAFLSLKQFKRYRLSGF